MFPVVLCTRAASHEAAQAAPEAAAVNRSGPKESPMTPRQGPAWFGAQPDAQLMAEQLLQPRTRCSCESQGDRSRTSPSRLIRVL